MARSHARSLLATMVALMLGGGCTAPASAQNRAELAHAVNPPAAPAPATGVAPLPAVPVNRLWPFTRLYNVDYVDVRAIAERYGLKPSWVTRGRILQLVDAQGRARLKFEDRKRDFYLDGVRVFLGEITVFNRGSLLVSKIDVIKTIAPLLRPAEHANQLPGPPKLIVLDAGHGGNDPGTQNTALHLDEKDLTLDVVLRLQKLLEGRGYRVILTRHDDTKLDPVQRADLEKRDDVANRARADLFLSVHFNSAVPTVTGTETYVMTPQFQLSSGAEKKDDTVDKSFPGNRQDFANVVLGYDLHRTLVADLKSSDRGFKRGRRLVLCFPECPAALVEAAYLSNDAEARRVATPEYRQQIAQAIADGIDAYAATLAAVHPPPTPAPPETHPPNAASH
ncbi:MAG TPA: N-acetylmuramoyl-L-alanine amidase [Opitutaceae bacterium]|nr:N-acetylmuramoyl-L-alanine amidase [Opitutaceae bacterium]